MQIFRSVRFNLWLFCLVAAACAVGTVVPQLPEVPDKVAAFLSERPGWGRLFDALGLFNVYHAPWFQGLLALMAFDIVVCKLKNHPPDAGLVRLPAEESADPDGNGGGAERPAPEAVLAAKPSHASFRTAAGPAAVAEAALGLLRASGYASSSSAVAGRQLEVGTRHGVQRWGSYISHVSLVVLLSGALIKSLFGFEEMLPILEGKSKTLERLPVEVHVDDFEVAYYAGTRTPRLFASDIRVYRLDKTQGEGAPPGGPFAAGALVGKKRILVNDPFEIPMDRWGLFKTKLYQASWGAGGMFRSVTLELGSKTLELPQRARVAVPGTDLAVTADLMLPNFRVDRQGQPGNASLDLENPAVRLQFESGKRRTPPMWLLERNPQAAFVERGDGTLLPAPPPPFRVAALDPFLFSGIQAGFDPGYPVVLAGSLGMLVGLSLLFYLHRRRLWVLALPEGDGSLVHVAGYSSRGPREFEREFDRRVAQLRALLPAPRSDAISAPEDAVGG